MKISKTITINYRAGHSYDETWTLDGELYCPNCGKQEVWVEQGPGDYYVGEGHLCGACRCTFRLPTLRDPGTDEYDDQRAAKLLS